MKTTPMKSTPMNVTRERGSALIEFAFCSMVWIPLLLGTVFIGINVARSIEVTQICRDAAHMHAYGVDFSQTSNKDILVHLSSGFNITPTAGNGVYILSTLMYVGDAECQAGGRTPDSVDCPNIYKTVFVRRLTVGNAQLRASEYGTPRSSYIDSAGNISSNGYLADSTMRVSNMPAALALTAGQNAYLGEAYFSSPDLDWTNFSSNQGIYSSFFF